MVRQPKISLTELAWAFVGFGLMCFLMGAGWSVSQAKDYQLELAEYRLLVGSALHTVRRVSNTLEEASTDSAIAPQQKREIQELTQQSDRILETVEQQIDRQTEELELLKPNTEE